MQPDKPLRHKVILWIGAVMIVAAVLTTQARIKKTDATRDLAATLCIIQLQNNVEFRAARIADNTMTPRQLAVSLATYGRLTQYCSLPADPNIAGPTGPAGATGATGP